MMLKKIIGDTGNTGLPWSAIVFLGLLQSALDTAGLAAADLAPLKCKMQIAGCMMKDAGCNGIQGEWGMQGDKD